MAIPSPQFSADALSSWSNCLSYHKILIILKRKNGCSNFPFLAFFFPFILLLLFCVGCVWGMCVPYYWPLCYDWDTGSGWPETHCSLSSPCLMPALTMIGEHHHAWPSTRLPSEHNISPCVDHPLSPTRSDMTCGEVIQVVIRLFLNIPGEATRPRSSV